MRFRFLYIADLHLGKVFYDHPILEYQGVILNQFVEVLTDTAYHVMVIAGDDVYDRSIPSPRCGGAVWQFSGEAQGRPP
jgi:exonuclease SbcD